MNLITRFPLRLTIPLFLLLLALLAEGYTMKYYRDLADTEEENKAVSLVTQDMNQLQANVNYRFRKGDLEGVQLAIAGRGSNPNITVLVLIDDDGTIISATSLKLVGVPVRNALPDVDAALIKEAGATLAGKVFQPTDRQSISAYYPVILGTKAGNIRPNRVGILHLRYDVASAKALRRHGLVHQGLAMAAFYTGCFLLLGLFLHVILSRRVSRLVSASRRFAAGDLSVQAGIEGNDELAQIGKAFDSMARKILIEQKSLRESEQKYRTIFDNVLDGLYLLEVTEEGSFRNLEINPALERSTGIPRSHVIGKTQEECVPGKTAEIVNAKYRNCVDAGRPIEEEAMLELPSGSRHYRSTLIPIADGSGRISSILGISRDITESKRNDEINASRLHLMQYAVTHSLDELREETLSEAEKLTHSIIGFYHFFDDDQQSLTLQNWSARTKSEFCTAAGKGDHYPIADAGVWVDCVYQRKPVIHNDYASLPHRKGIPEGHAKVIRELVVPVFRGEKIKAILGVGNKAVDYTEKDVEAVALLADLAWEIAERKQAEQHLELLDFALNNVRDEAYLISEQACFHYVNDQSCRALGYGREELLGMNVAAVDPDFPLERWPEHWRELREQGSSTFEGCHRAKDGRIYPVEISANYFEYGGRGYNLALVRDITERKHAEAELARVNRALRMLSDSNQTLMRITDEATLLSEVCRIAVGVGGYRMAWVAFAEQDDAKTLRPVAHAGTDSDYIEAAKLTWADTERGRGPGGTAVRTGQPCLIRNVQDDASFAPWKEDALRRGYHAVIALPLIIEGRTFGALGIYAGETDAFEDREVAILSELAGDLAFGINALRARARQNQAEVELKQSEEEYRTLIQKIQAAVVVHGADTRIVTSNSMAQKLLGLTEEQLLGKTAIDPDWHFFREDGTAMPLEEYPVNRVYATRRALRNYVVGVHHPAAEKDVWVLVNADPVMNKEGEIAQIIVTFIDITERKVTEAALRSSEQNLALHVMQTPLGVIEWDLDFKAVKWNPAAERIFGYSKSEALGRHASLIVPLAAKEQVDQVWSALVVRKGGLRSTNENTTKDGRRIYCEWYNTPLVDDSGNVIAVASLVQDITEHKRAEEERRENLKFFESMDKVNRAIHRTNDLEQMMSDVLGVVLSVFDCDRAYFVYPCDPAAASYRVPMERTTPAYPGALAKGIEVPVDAETIRVFRTVMESDDPVTFGPGSEAALPSDLSKYFGVQSQAAMAIYPKIDKPYMFGVHQCSYARIWTAEETRLLREIGRRLADALTSLLSQRDLQDSEARYRRLLETSNEGIWVIGEDFRTTFVNARMADMIGCQTGEMIGRPVTDFMFAEDAPDHQRKMEARRMGLSEYYERRYRHKNGQTVWTLASAVPIMDSRQKFIGSFAMFTDITERKAAEEALKKSETFVRNILDSVDEGFIVVDRQYRIVSANRAFCGLMMLPEDRVVGRLCYELTHHSASPCFESGGDCPVRRTFETGAAQIASHIHADESGTKQFVDLKSYPITDASGAVVSAIETVIDVTEKRKLEDQLIQAQKMEAIGTLAGGVAHDFNNILTAIIGYGHIVKMKMQPADPLRASIDQILASSDRAAHLTQGLLAFSRKQVLNPRPVDLNDIVRNVEKLLRRLIGEDISLSTELAGNSLIAMADAGQIEQVLMNFATNARDAMPGGGALMITTQEVDLHEDFVALHGFGKPGKHALIAVSDTGIGMDEKTREKIFDPFFTTKDPGKGTGLGLAIVYGIIKQHSGNINVYSEPGKGTTFKIYLPLIVTDVEEPSSETSAPPRGGTETILLAEDDREVRDLTVMILKEYGYHVIEAVDGEDALGKFKDHAGEIALLVLDVIMPRKSGKEAFDAIKAVRPEVDALFISGYTADIIHRKGISEAGFDFISKPVSPFELLRKIRQLLDKRKKSG